jgi:hypothetical protein
MNHAPRARRFDVDMAKPVWKQAAAATQDELDLKAFE